VQPWFESLWDWIYEGCALAVQPVWDWIWEGANWVWDQVTAGLDWVVETVTAALEGIPAAVSAFITETLETAGELWESLAEGVNATVTFIIDSVTDGLAWLETTIFGWVDGSLRWATDAILWLNEEGAMRADWLVTKLEGASVDLYKGGLDWVQMVLAGMAKKIGEGLQDLLKWLISSLEWLASSIATWLEPVKNAIEGIFTGLATGIINALVAAVSPSSPDEEVVKQAQEFVDGYMKRLKELLEKKPESVPELDKLIPMATGVIALNMGAAVGAQVAGAALDQAHPMKAVGFLDIAMDLITSFQFPAVIGPILAGPIWPSILIPLRYRYNELYPTAVPMVRELPELAARGVVDVDEYTQAMKFHALDETWSKRILAAAYRAPGFSDLQLMAWREAVTEDQFVEALRLQGVKPEYVEAYKAITARIPGPGDLVRMAVREAFTREELQVEFPVEFGEWMEKQGYAKIWALYYWAAHWVLVPLGQLYDLYHRGLIGDDVLDAQLKYHDYPPEWRGLLKKLSWDLPGRIDARWMFRWGLIDVDRLRDLLVSRGLDPEWADDVAMATARQQWLPEINRLRDNLKRDYIRGYIVEEELRAGLEGLGYPPEWIEFHVRDALEDGERALMDDMVDALGDGYLKDLVTDEELEVGLGAVIVRARALQMELERLWIRKYRKPKAPTAEKVSVLPVSTLRRAYREEIISAGELEAELLARGYAPEDVELILSLEAAMVV